MGFLYGVLGTVAVLILFFGGVLTGWKLKAFDLARTTKRSVGEMPEEERRKLKEQIALQEAFRQVTNYSQDVAYGNAPQNVLQGGEQT